VISDIDPEPIYQTFDDIDDDTSNKK